MTLDLDFWELTIGDQRPAAGVIILRSADFARNPGELSEQLIGEIAKLGEALTGHLTNIEPGRVRQRNLEIDERN